MVVAFGIVATVGGEVHAAGIAGGHHLDVGKPGIRRRRVAEIIVGQLYYAQDVVEPTGPLVTGNSSWSSRESFESPLAELYHRFIFDGFSKTVKH